MPKCPYTFPHRSKKARIAYLAEHESYHPLNSNNGGFCLSWNVKIHSPNFDGKKGECHTLDSRDAAWEDKVENDAQIFWDTCGDVFISMAEDYCSYPGDDQGNYDFRLNGRSGGHLILTKCEIVSQPKAWRMYPMIWGSRAEYHDWLETRSKEEIERFYKAVRCMDQDFTREKLTSEFEYHLNYARGQWEEEQDEKATDAARSIEASRPDMYA